MARCSTYRLREKKTGRERTVNQSAYNADLAGFKGWDRIGETHVDGEGAVVETGDEPENASGPAEEAPPPAPKAERKGPVRSR